jgi:glycosyltransferase involved in cell wall biosynthesis
MTRRVMHVITTLTTGGAEVMLLRLLSRMDRNVFEAEVVCLASPGRVGEQIRALGIPVHSLEMNPGRPDPRVVLRLARLIRARRPEIVQTWMYHADLIGGVAARLAGRSEVVWGIHNSTLPRTTKRSTRLVVAALSRLSHRVPRRIVACAAVAREVHRKLGYDDARMVTIPNGFDMESYRPDPAARRSVREELGLAVGTRLIGLVARFHPQKDHRNFVRAAGELHKAMPGVHFVLCGDGVDAANLELAGWIREAGVVERVHPLGPRDDTPRIMASLDLLCSSSSFGEAFPLVVGEAMASGVPCVVTDIGDSALLVGDTGAVVPPRDPVALASAWRDLLGLGATARASLGARARERIASRYSLEEITRRYEDLYRTLLNDRDTCAA